MEAVASRDCSVHVPEPRINEAGPGGIPRGYAAAADLPLIAQGAADDRDDPRPGMRMPGQRAVWCDVEVLSEDVRPVTLHRTRERRNVEGRNVVVGHQ
jgi:hypothetical protein